MSFSKAGDTEATNNYLYMVYLENGTLHAFHETTNASNVRVDLNTTEAPVNDWSHVAVVRDTTRHEYQAFINGIPQERQSYATNSNNRDPVGGSQSLLRFGTNANDAFFTGDLSLVRIWDRVRSADEIAESMDVELSPQSGLVGQFTFEGDGTTVANSVGNDANANGTLGSSNKEPSRVSLVLEDNSLGLDGYQEIPLTGIGSGGDESQELRLTVREITSGLIEDAYVQSDGDTAVLKYKPGEDQSGLATLVVTVTDAGLDRDLDKQHDNASTEVEVDILVSPINDAPTLNEISNRSIDEDSGIHSIRLSGLSAGGGEDQPIQIDMSHSNADLLTDLEVSQVEGDTHGTLTFGTLMDQFGSSTVTVTVTDGGFDRNLSTAADNGVLVRIFNVNVLAVNDLPTLNEVADVSIEDASSAPNVTLTGITAGGDENQPLEVTAQSLNATLMDTPDVGSLTGTELVLSLNPIAGQAGQGAVLVTVTDGGLDGDLSTTDDNGSFSREFQVTIGHELGHVAVAAESLITADGTRLNITPGALVLHAGMFASSPNEGGEEHFTLGNGPDQGDGSKSVIVTRGDGANAVTATFTNVTSIVFDGGPGNDSLTVGADLAVPVLASGGAGSDSLQGGAQDDDLRGGFGADLLEGREGNDVFSGGGGADTMLGGGGNDTAGSLSDADEFSGGVGGRDGIVVHGTDGDDVINVHWEILFHNDDDHIHHDHLHSGDHDHDDAREHCALHPDADGFCDHVDVLVVTVNGIVTKMVYTPEDDVETIFVYAGAGDDTVIMHDDGAGQHWNAEFHGGDGNDLLIGANELFGRPRGNDRLFGGEGNDTLHGNAGNDHLDGGPGLDHISGGDGDDFVVTSLGADVFVGGTGIDGLEVTGTDGDDDISIEWTILFAEDDPEFRDLVLGTPAQDQHDEHEHDREAHDHALEETAMREGCALHPENGEFCTHIDVLVLNVNGTITRMIYTPEDDDETVVVYAGAGNDRVVMSDDGAGQHWNAEFHGEEGDDLLVGTNELFGRPRGNDRLFGGPGDDTLQGNAGNDWLEGGPGRDVLEGGPADDILVTYLEDEFLDGGREKTRSL